MNLTDQILKQTEVVLGTSKRTLDEVDELLKRTDDRIKQSEGLLEKNVLPMDCCERKPPASSDSGKSATRSRNRR